MGQVTDCSQSSRPDPSGLDQLTAAIHRLADVWERSMASGLGGALTAGHNPAPPRSPQAALGMVLTPRGGGDRGA